jgi:hypothetical protein
MTDFDLFNIGASDESFASLEKQAKNDGIYRPKLKDGKDGQYRAKIRFLPNLHEDGKPGLSIIRKFTHYLKMSEQSLSGYVDCLKNFEKDCPICTKYWAWENSKNAADKEKQEKIQRSTKFYSYILVEEDENNPDWVGKIMIWSYGHDIAEKITMEKKGDNQENEDCDVFNILNGKTLQLIIKSKGKGQDAEKITYAPSFFQQSSPVKLYDEKSGKFVIFPTDPEKQEKAKDKYLKVFFAKEVMLEDFAPKPWDDEMTAKVDKTLSVLSGKDIYSAEQSIKKSKKDVVQEMDDDFDSMDDNGPISNTDAQTADDFFSIDTD